MDLLKFFNKTISWSFYLLFLLVPLVFAGNTSELFELNKMWVTFGLTAVIMMGWLGKMILTRQFRVQKTPLDWVLLAFLLSQIISSFLSLDSRISFWGYYSRFNGGLLSLLCYVGLYYALVTNFSRQQVINLLKVIVLSGLLVALWGFPSHFGKDPTCYLFRGKLDVECWTDAFRPTIRMFSTLGQPAWMSAFLAALLPITFGFGLKLFHKKTTHEQRLVYITGYLMLIALFYACLLYTNTRAGFIAFWLGFGTFWAATYYKKYLSHKLFIQSFAAVTTLLLILNFFIGTPIPQLDKFSYHTLFQPPAPVQTPANKPAKAVNPADSYDLNVTSSGDIRLYVWQGAIAAWKDNFLFGTGVETFAFAYYKYRPQGHNLTSEWDYLYNKAHNEYLNYLTTTGTLGLGTYLAFIGLFSFFVLRPMLLRKKDDPPHEKDILVIGIFSGWVTLLVSNFFGFSVVIINLFFFVLPAVALFIGDLLPEYTYHFPKEETTDTHVSVSQWFGLGIVAALTGYFLLLLMQFWQADAAYALGTNLEHAGDLQGAYPLLQEASTMRPSEPIFKDELSYSSAQLAVALYSSQQATAAAQLAQQAVTLSDDVLSNHPNNIVFWKTRIRIFYALSQLDGRYLPFAIKAAEEAAKLAPTDAKIRWNLGVLYGQNGQSQQAIDTLRQAITLKPDYTDAYYALGLFYHDSSVDEKGKVINKENAAKAVETMHYILEKLDSTNTQVKKALEQWGEN